MFQLLNKRMQDISVDVMSCHMCAFDIVFQDGPSQEYNALKPLMHEHDNLSETHHNTDVAL